MTGVGASVHFRRLSEPLSHLIISSLHQLISSSNYLSSLIPHPFINSSVHQIIFHPLFIKYLITSAAAYKPNSAGI